MVPSVPSARISTEPGDNSRLLPGLSQYPAPAWSWIIDQPRNRGAHSPPSAICKSIRVRCGSYEASSLAIALLVLRLAVRPENRRLVLLQDYGDSVTGW